MSMATVADSKKLEALVNTVSDECKILFDLIKNTFETDKQLYSVNYKIMQRVPQIEIKSRK